MLVGSAFAQAEADQFFSFGGAWGGAYKEMVQLDSHADKSNSIWIVWPVLLRRRGAGFGGGCENEAFADKGEAFVRKFSLEELVFGAGEEVCDSAGDGGLEVVDRDGLAVEDALLVG